MAEDNKVGTVGQGDERDPDTKETAETKTDATERPEGAEESFIDPSDLPEDLKPHWKRMHRAYTRSREEFKDLKEKAGLVDRFNTDPAFTIQVVQEVAQRMGYQFTKAQAASAVQAAAGTGLKAPADIIEAVRSTLSPELQWMAESLAAAQWAAMQPMIKQRDQDTQQRNQDAAAQRDADYKQLEQELTEAAPGWEEHEDDMDELLKFLQSGQTRHARFGSKLEMLYNIVTGRQHAVREAIRRQSEAARSRSSTGMSTRSVSNITDKVRDKSKSFREVFEEAAKHATTELEKEGHRFS